jgi:penicillin-binding protein 4
MTDVLKGVFTKSWAIGYGLGLNNIPAAGKTGTTSSSKDGWFAGYTPYFTTVV